MTDIKLKVCGMRERDNILEVAKLKPDYMGFIFYAPSPRFVGADFVVPKELPGSVKRVGVFVNEGSKAIMEGVRRHGLHAVQLHGDEDPEQCRQLKAYGVEVIKVFSVDGDTDFSKSKAFSGAVDFFLFDTKGKFYGGNANVFDWKVLSRYREDIPFFLSGGLSPENTAEIERLDRRQLYAVDVNSGVEIAPAVKDPKRVGRIQTILETLKKT